MQCPVISLLIVAADATEMLQSYVPSQLLNSNLHPDLPFAFTANLTRVFTLLDTKHDPSAWWLSKLCTSLIMVAYNQRHRQWSHFGPI